MPRLEEKFLTCQHLSPHHAKQLTAYRAFMHRFSQRQGLTPVPTVVQVAQLDDATRLSLWNMILRVNRLISDRREYTAMRKITSELWATTLEQPIDEEPYEEAVWSQIKDVVLDGEWHEALDVVEAYIDEVESNVRLDGDLRNIFNDIFARFLVAYKFVEGILIPVDSEEEAAAFQEVAQSPVLGSVAKDHLKQAALLLANRTAPDYANSVKESISAVESLVRTKTGEATLGAGLKKLERAGVAIHPALAAAWGKLYGWTSDAQGIRHGAIESSDVSQSIAKYMLISCSAFISYLLSESTN